MNKEQKKLQNKNRHKFLIDHFFNGKSEGYEERHLEGWVLVKYKQPNGWGVQIFTVDSFKKSQEMFKLFGGR